MRVPALKGICLYLPAFRIEKGLIASQYMQRARGTRTFRWFDEDECTMAIEASMGVVEGTGVDTIGCVIYAAEKGPYRRKSTASVIADVLGLSTDTLTVDITGSERVSAEGLLVAKRICEATGQEVLVTGGFCEHGEPGSDEDIHGGDAGWAMVVGEGGGIVLEEFWVARANVFVKWERGEDTYFLPDGFTVPFELLPTAAAILNRAIEKSGASKVVIGTSSNRLPSQLKRKLGDRNITLFHHDSTTTGVLGSASLPFAMADAVEKCEPGESIVMLAPGDGALAITAKSSDPDNVKIVRINAENPVVFDLYGLYRKIVTYSFEEADTSPIAYWRDAQRIFQLRGGKCGNCGKVFYPYSDLCPSCGFTPVRETVPLSREGRVFTYTTDHITPSPIGKVTHAVVELEGGGRIFVQMTDSLEEMVEIGAPVKLVIRRIHSGGGIENYGWKARMVK